MAPAPNSVPSPNPAATRAWVAAGVLDVRSVSHGEIKPLEPFGIAVLAFRDPDNIQVELTAPL